MQLHKVVNTYGYGVHSYVAIKTHGSELQGQGGSTLQQPLDERT